MSEQPPPYPGPGWVPPGGVPAQPPPLQPGYNYGYPPPYYPGAPPPPREPSKTMAIIALILAVIPCGITWLVAVVLAVIVLVQVKKGAARGRGLAIAALVISFLWLAVAAVGVTLIVKEANNYDAARAANEGTVRPDMVRTSDCLVALPDDEEIRTVEIIPCSKPHRGEVYAEFSIKPGDDPTQQDIYDLADAGCRSRLEDFVGSGRGSRLEYGYVAPDKDAAFDDDVSCYVVTPNQKQSTGSLEGSRD